MSTHDVTVSRTIRATPERVWAALTEPDLVARWMMGATVDSTWRAGDPVTWRGEYEGRTFEDKGEVVEAVENERLVHTHFSPMSGAEDVPENYHRLTWTLEPQEDGTVLTLVQSGAGSAEEAEQFEQNWSMMLDALRDAAES